MTRRIEYLEAVTAEYVTVKQAAAMLGISEGYIRDLLKYGEFTTYKIEGQWPTWLSLSELEARKRRRELILKYKGMTR